MTAQAPELMVYEGHVYPIVAELESSIPFNPHVHGLKTSPMSTACWRGYQSTFAIEKNSLVLHSLDINLEDYLLRDRHERQPPDFNGVPAVAARNSMGCWHYSSINLPIEYSGQIIIASDAVNLKLARHGENPVWNYYEVRGLDFNHGVYQGQVDLSDKMAEIRKKKGLDEPVELRVKRFNRSRNNEYLDVPGFLESANNKTRRSEDED